MSPALELFAHRIVAALFNGLYQGMVLAAVLWLGLRLFRRTNAATRHAAGFVGLLAIAALPVIHFIWPLTNRELPKSPNHPLANLVGTPEDLQVAPTNPPDTVSALSPDAPTREELPEPVGGLAETTAIHSPLADAAPVITDDPVQVSTDPLKVSPGQDLGIKSVTPVPAILEEPADHSTDWQVPGTVIIPRRDGTESSVALPSPFKVKIQYWRAAFPGLASATLVIGLGLVALLRLVRLGCQFIALARLKRMGWEPSADISDVFNAIVREARIERPVRLLATRSVASPMAVGFLHPVVLLPESLSAITNRRSIESVLRHELAHIHRRDDWTNLVQQILHAALFFHPAIWWLSRQLTIDREIACDDHALARLDSRHDYALFLTEFAGRARSHDWIAAPAAWSSNSHLKKRITMILDNKRNTSSRLARARAGVITLATLTTAGLALIAGPRLVLAETAGSAPATTSSDAVATTPTAGYTSSASTVSNGDSRQDLSQPTSVTVFTTHSLPVATQSHSVVTLRNGDVVTTAPVAADVSVNTDVDVSDVNPRVVVVNETTSPEAPDDVTPPKGPKPAPEAAPAPEALPLQPTRPDRPTKSADPARDLLERRIERLERMIDKLTAERRDFHFNFVPAPGQPNGQLWNDKDKLKKQKSELDALIKSDKKLTYAFNQPMPNWSSEDQQKEMAKAMKDAQQQMARAQKEFEANAREAEQKAREHAKRSEERMALKTNADAKRRALEQQKQALERQKDEMSRQMDRLEHQMDKLDQQMDRLDEQMDNENDNADQQKEKAERDQAAPKFKEKQENQ